MMENLFLKSIDEFGIATITLNRAEIHNAFNDELIAGLTDCFIKMESDDNVKIVVLTGNGKSFCAGADLNWMKKMIDYSEEENISDSMNLANLFHTINSFSKPVIGKINGAALGGGSGLVAVCDHVIAHEDAIFGFTETRLGIVPAVISPFVLRKIGESHGRTLFLSGRRFNATHAKEIGLVHQISLDRHFEKDVMDICQDFLKAAPGAQKVCKHMIYDVVNMTDVNEAKVYTCGVIAKRRVSDEGQDGMCSLLEKRKPMWVK